MAFHFRFGRRLLASLQAMDPGACPTATTIYHQLGLRSSVLSLSGARGMAGGDEPGSRPSGAAAPPPPGTSPSAAPLSLHPPKKQKPSVTAAPSPLETGPPRPTPPAAAQTPQVPPPTKPEPAHAQPSPSGASPSSPSPSPSPSPAADTSAATTSSKPSEPGSGSGSGSAESTSRTEDATGAGAQQPDGSDPLRYVHKHFSLSEEFRQVQPKLEEMERRHAYEGLTGGGRGTSWTLLYDSPPARLLGALLQPLRAAARSVLFPGLLARLQGNAEGLIREYVEQDFDANEFLEGVQEAVPVFFDAVAAGDSQALSKMASAKAVEAMERDRRRLREEHGLEVRSVSTTVNQVALGGTNLWGPASMRGFDQAWAAEEAPGMTQSWLVAIVHLDVKLDVVYGFVNTSSGQPWDSAGGGGAGAGGEGSKREVSSVVRRTGSWLLARGPLPHGLVKSLDSSWKLVGWW